MKKSTLLLLAILLFLTFKTEAQEGFVHTQSTSYEWPQEPLVLKKLDQWQDLKFGIIFHWGLYAVPGIVESWALCSEDVDWISRYGHTNYQKFKEWYWEELSKRFNPKQFDPTQWAEVAQRAGMKYVVFTTKHHDGFCMFDSQLTNFTIARGPFAQHPKADVAKHVFHAFRQKEFLIGAYFSKPDWHSQDYWWDYFATPNRNVNYTISRHPKRWEAYKRFTQGQIDELMTGYGSIDILWLDGGWVNPDNQGQDIDMPTIARQAREKQPGLLIVDRTIHGKYENYQTPEQHIPDNQLPHPWESCVTLTTDWGWVPNAKYKTPQRIIAMLMEVVAKGGNLLLGVGPTAEGLLEPQAVEHLERIGQWMRQNGKAIYNTRITPRYKDGNTWFTADKNGRTLYALHAPTEDKLVPAILTWQGNVPSPGSNVCLLATGKRLKWSVSGESVQVQLPAHLIGSQTPFALQIERVNSSQ